MDRGDAAPATPRLSVVVPMFNAEAFIERALGSLRCIPEPGRQAVELWVIDDGSTDGSADLAAAWLDVYGATFRGAELIRKANGGSATARNAGLERATGDWLLMLDADDELLIDPLPLFDQHPDASLILYTIELATHGKVTGQRQPARINHRNRMTRLTAASPIPVCALLKRKQLDTRFNEEIRQGEDWLFWLSNPRVFDHVVRLPGTRVARIHAHGNNKSSNYHRRGKNRAWIARRTLDTRREQLNATQRNNLKLQIQIGEIQQGLPLRWASLCLWPCTPSLYAKLWVYAVLRSRFGMIDSYGSSPSTQPGNAKAGDHA